MRDCCKDLAKRQAAATANVQKCSVCGVLHYTMKAEPGHVGSTLKGGPDVPSILV